MRFSFFNPIMYFHLCFFFSCNIFLDCLDYKGLRRDLKASARKNLDKNLRKWRRSKQSDTSLSNKILKDEQDNIASILSIADNNVQENKDGSSLKNSEEQTTSLVPSRRTVLQACTVTSGLICTLGVIVRQSSHFLHQEGLPIIDCSTEIPFTFELWHLELILGLVALISSCRYLLLKTWPDFAESSEAANRQVLTSLEPLEYMIVAFLPGISEELFFRGALLPIFGINWTSILGVASLFGVLHLGSGRKYSFAVWATFVGVAYGYATVLSSSIIVPMVSHAMNNLVGAIMWRYMSSSSSK